MLLSLLEDSQSGYGGVEHCCIATGYCSVLPLTISKLFTPWEHSTFYESTSVQPEKGGLSCTACREYNCLSAYLQGLIPSLYP